MKMETARTETTGSYTKSCASVQYMAALTAQKLLIQDGELIPLTSIRSCSQQLPLFS
ncbi:hypothetical protein [Paenibacillus zanthoxyli]|uniref:hypothetical protein n=1 Tax=Paenibacillus zanthoxyli TaxID=369399 RepID=UPI0012EC4578|nr:hypothetical protein [Paenibacillus zanthoxyli]